MPRINPKIDLVFKKLFGSEENKDILISLINAVLPESQQITAVTLKNPYNVSDYAEGKLSILDVKAEDEYGNLYDIEMQIKGTTFYGKRTLYYWAKIFGSQLDYLTDEEIKRREQRGRSYTDLNKCIVISLMDFTFFKDDRYARCFVLKDRETDQTHVDLDYLDLYFVELEKFDHKYKTVRTTLDRWIQFLNHADFYSKDTLPRELAEVEPIRKASERLEAMYLNQRERAYYDAQQKRYLDETSRIQEAVKKAVDMAVKDAVDVAVKDAVDVAVKEAVDVAVEQTKLDGQVAVAKNALTRGFDNETIAALTGLTVARVEQLRRAEPNAG
ncbi:MAG: Rpn family recombination-promoting nuclease/putative transposase [Catalinimonas sp.]